MKDTLTILIFADLHAECTDKIRNADFSKRSIDVCFTLGDIDYQHLQIIQKKVNCPVYGVLGNHDEYGMFECYGISDLDCKYIYIQNYSVTGLSGSSRYKMDNSPMLTQKESITVSKQLSYADILISHDSAYGLHGQRTDEAHCGLKGITRYLKKFKPHFHIYGHHHENTVQVYKKTIAVCVFGCAVIEIEKENNKSVLSKVEHIF